MQKVLYFGRWDTVCSLTSRGSTKKEQYPPSLLTWPLYRRVWSLWKKKWCKLSPEIHFHAKLWISMSYCGFPSTIVDFHAILWYFMRNKRNEKCLYTRIGESCLSILLLMHRNKFDYFSAIAKLFSRNGETFKSTFYSLLLWPIS